MRQLNPCAEQSEVGGFTEWPTSQLKIWPACSTRWSEAGLIITGNFTGRRFTQFSINSMAHYNDGPCGSTKSYAVADAELFIGLGALPNRCPTCLRTGDWCDNRLVDRSRMNREIHVRFCERLRGKLPRSTRLSGSLIFSFLAKTFKIPQKHHPEKTHKIMFIHIIDIEP